MLPCLGPGMKPCGEIPAKAERQSMIKENVLCKTAQVIFYLHCCSLALPRDGISLVLPAVPRVQHNLLQKDICNGKEILRVSSWMLYRPTAPILPSNVFSRRAKPNSKHLFHFKQFSSNLMTNLHTGLMKNGVLYIYITNWDFLFKYLKITSVISVAVITCTYLYM